MTAPSEIAAVAAGRKPVFHEFFSEELSDAMDEAAEGLAKAFPSLRVESFGGHLIVVDPETAGVIAGTADPEATMEAVREAAESGNIGEFLGYGQSRILDPGSVDRKSVV